MENALAWDSNSGENVNMFKNEKSKKAKITISRNSDDKVRITIYDVTSNIEFAEVELELEDYALAITGLARVEGNLIVRNLNNVGKKKITEKRQISLPDHLYDRSAIKDWMIENCQEEGYKLDTYIGSQQYITYNPQDQKRVLQYSVFKYEDAEGPE